jgi:hypothetical protein
MDTEEHEAVVGFRQSILNELFCKRPDRALFHYTTQAGLLGIIRDKQIWATHHQCLNDIQEFLYAKDLVRKELNGRAAAASGDSLSVVKAMLSVMDQKGFEDVDLYIACFSEVHDSLALWRTYGGLTSGFALRYEGTLVNSPARFEMRPCLYREEQQREVIKALVAEVLERTLKYCQVTGASPEQFVGVDLRTKLHRLGAIIKHPTFAEEKEWRLISEVMTAWPGEGALKFREGKSMIVPYRCIPLDGFTQVIVGPNPNPEQSARSVRSLLSSEGIRGVEVVMSDVPYRNW